MENVLPRILAMLCLTSGCFFASTSFLPSSFSMYAVTVKDADLQIHRSNFSNMLQTGLIVGGWDKYEGGKIYGVPLGGTVIKAPFAIGGSGSSYLYGFFDQAWREGMTKDEAEKLVVKAVFPSHCKGWS
ncbi:proteasome subunit beta type-6-like [Rosa rugosa]|uniref:proteasome subunit beta type-6-like n=1 Tax=Rosa rugosa TaxID=74645 RepID=UPI002B40700F|nr:proteasome subunit beta type-6-like [Rosa rugosa]